MAARAHRSGHRVSRGLLAFLLAGLAVVFLGGGCGPSRAEERAAEAKRKQEDAKRRAEVVARLSPAVKRRIAQVDRLRAGLRAIPPAAPGAAAPVATPPVKLRELHHRDPASNADVMMEADLTLLERGILGSCSYYLRRDAEDLMAHEAEDILTGCTTVRYFLVVRPAEKVKAQLAGSSSYTGGEIAGDVVVFELPDEGDPKLLGAFPIEITLTGKVKVRADATREHVEYELNESLRKELLTAIENKLGR